MVSSVSTTVSGRHLSRSSTSTTTRRRWLSSGDSISVRNSPRNSSSPRDRGSAESASSPAASVLIRPVRSSTDGSCKVSDVFAATCSAFAQSTRLRSVASIARARPRTWPDFCSVLASSAATALRTSPIRVSLAPTPGS